MKTFSLITFLLISTLSYSQCDQLKEVAEANTITTTTPTKIKEFSISKIWFNDYSPPSSLIYLFLNATGEYMDFDQQKEKSESENVIIHFSDQSTLELRMIIDNEFAENEMYRYKTVIYLNAKLLNELSSKNITHYELFGFSTQLSEKKARKLREYLNCMLSD